LSDLRSTLKQLPDDLPVVLRQTGGTVTYTETAAYWREQFNNYDDSDKYEIVGDVHLPEEVPDTRFIDLQAVITGNFGDIDWLIEPLLPAKKLVGLVSARGVGKSLLALDMACRLATGHPMLDEPGQPSQHVLYLDYEMGVEDLQDRLFKLGWDNSNPDTIRLLDHLHYMQLPDIPPLDTPNGGETLLQLLDDTNATLVVIDTVSRVVTGDENNADTYRELFNHSEKWIRGRGATLLRLDHLGKDTSKGSRGSSAKEDPLDVVWQMEPAGLGETFDLRLTKNRPGWLPHRVVIHREDKDGELTHTTPRSELEPGATVLVDRLDTLGAEWDATRAQAAALLREKTGKVGNNNHLAQAVSHRKRRGPKLTLATE
jgi:hypothetical protein